MMKKINGIVGELAEGRWMLIAPPTCARRRWFVLYVLLCMELVSLSCLIVFIIIMKIGSARPLNHPQQPQPVLLCHQGRDEHELSVHRWNGGFPPNCLSVDDSASLTRPVGGCVLLPSFKTNEGIGADMQMFSCIFFLAFAHHPSEWKNL